MNGGARNRRARATTVMEGVPATGGDARGYGVKTADGVGKSTAFGRECQDWQGSAGFMDLAFQSP